MNRGTSSRPPSIAGAAAVATAASLIAACALDFDASFAESGNPSADASAGASGAQDASAGSSSGGQAGGGGEDAGGGGSEAGGASGDGGSSTGGSSTGGSSTGGSSTGGAAGSTTTGFWPDSPTVHCISGSMQPTCPNPGELLYGQDGNYQIRVPKYATTFDTVDDPVTGLTWQRVAGAWAGQSQASNACENLDAAGFSDWRLPSRRELISIVDYGQNEPAFDATVFSGPGVGWYWTSTPSLTQPGFFWAVGVSFGRSAPQAMSENYSVRCVRGSLPQQQLTLHSSWVEDSLSGFSWQRTPPPAPTTWAGAIGFCESLTLAGKNDWRLPSVKELTGFLDDAYESPALPPNTLPDIGKAEYWTSTPVEAMPGYAYFVNAGTAVSDYAVTGSNRSAFCVRGP